MFEQLKSWLAVTAVTALSLFLFAGLGLAGYLIIRVISFGISLMNINFK